MPVIGCSHLEQFCNLLLEDEPLVEGQSHEPKWLKAAARAPHRKHHLRGRPHRPRTQLKRQRDPGSLLDVRRQFQQPTGRRKLMQFRRERSPVFQPDGRRHYASQADARSAPGLPRLEELTHSISLLCARANWLRHSNAIVSAFAQRFAPRLRAICSSAASEPSRTRMPFRMPGRSDSDVPGHPHAATRTGACIPVEELFSEDSMRHHLIPVFPVIEPA